MTDDQQARADERFQQALEARGARDPREYYRERLKDLRESSPDEYQVAVNHYRETLIPGIADGGDEPLLAWMEYGRLLAEVSAPGRTVTLDATGREAPYEPGTGMGLLVLHLPEEQKRRALVVALPPELSPAQRAAFDLLVRGKQKLPS